MSRLRKGFSRAAWIAGAGLLLLGPFLAPSDYWLRIANNVSITMLLTLGLDFIWGRAGQISFAQAGFFAIGAYSSALLALHFGIPVLLCIALGGAAGAASSVVLGWPALRLKTHYFAVATFGFAEIIRLVAMNWQSVTRGFDGLTKIPAPSIGPLSLDGDRSYYYLLLSVVAVAVICYRRLLSSKYGRAFTAIREGELAAELVGVDVARVKLLAFVLSALYAAVAGGLYAHLFSVISPDSFSFEVVSIPVLVALFVGGSGSIAGVAVGSAIVTWLPEALRALGQWYMAVYGAGVIVMLIYAPDGIAGLVRWMQGRRDARPAVAEVAAASRPLPGDAADGWRARPGATLCVQGLTKRFGGVIAADSVSFEVESGRIKSLIGPNGAGKTTVLNLITGIYRPDAGSARLGDRELVGVPPYRIARAGVLRTFQNIRVWKELTVRENVLVALHTARDEERALLARADAALEAVGLAHLSQLPAGNLPHGHRRLLELARCIAGSPRVILLDEPAAGLNAQECRMLLERLVRVREQGTAILLVEHNMLFVMAISDSIVVMDSGRKIAEGAPGEVRNDPLVVQAYLGADVAIAAS
ncbi:MAG: branched-chain amino acid ABC transporter ATP-binding protein/permease [Betaproteobacteria bacterium]